MQIQEPGPWILISLGQQGRRRALWFPECFLGQIPGRGSRGSPVGLLFWLLFPRRIPEDAQGSAQHPCRGECANGSVLLKVKGGLCSLFNKISKDLVNDEDTSPNGCHPIT